MDYVSYLRAKVAIEGLPKAHAELAGLDAAMHKVASTAGAAGGDLDKTAAAAKRLDRNLAAARGTVAGTEGDLRRTARAADQSAGALGRTSVAARDVGREVDRARTSIRGLGADLGAQRKSTDDARGGVAALGSSLQSFGADLRRVHDDAGRFGSGMSAVGRDLHAARAEADEAAAATRRLQAEVARGIHDDQYEHLAQRLAKTRAAADAAGVGIGGFGDDLRRVRAAVTDAHSGLSPFSDELGRAREESARAAAALGDTGDSANQLVTGLTRAQRIVAGANSELEKTGAVSARTQAELRNLASRGVGGLDKATEHLRATVAKARAELADTGSVSRRTRRDLDGLAGGAGGAGGGLAALSGGLAGLPGGIGALGTAAAFTVPTLIALGGSAVAVGAALGPLVGLAGAAAVGLSAAAQGFGVLKLATGGIAEALREQTTNQDAVGKSALQSGDAQRAAAKAIAAAQEGVRTARMGVEDATRRVTDAERTYADALGGIAAAESNVAKALQGARAAQAALTQARSAARQQIIDTQAALTDSLLAEERATFAVKDARTALAALNAGPSARALADAHEAITDALRAERTAAFALQDAHRAVGDALRGQERAVLSLGDAHDRLNALLAGPNVADVADANDSVDDAMRAQERAAFDLADAQRALDEVMADPRADPQAIARARLDLRDAENAVGDAARATARARERLAELQKPASERDLAKARLDVADAEAAVSRASDTTAHARLGVEDAENAVGDARRSAADAVRALADLEKPASAYELAKARLAVREAENALAGAVRDHRRAAAALLDVEARGIGQSQPVVDARRAIADANERVRDAQQGVNDAMRAAQDAALGVTDAERDLAESKRQVARALQGVDDAQLDAASSAAAAAVGAGRLTRAMDALPAPAQAFVRQLIDLKPKLDDLRASAAAGFFPGATAGLVAAARNFESVKTVVAETAGVLGELAGSAGELVGSKAWGTDIEQVGRRNAGIMRILGGATLHIADALRHVIVAAGPLTTWLARSTEAWAANVEQSAKAGRETGRMAEFFERTRAVLRRLASITSNVAGGLLGIGKAGSRSGNDILRSIDSAARRFNEWANSVEGRRSIQQFFEDARRLAGALVPVLAGAAAAVATLALRFEPLTAALRLLGPFADEAILAFIGFKAAMTAAAAVRALSGALIFLAANPVIAVVVGIAAVAAGFAIAYQKIGWFRDAVDSVIGFVKSNWPLLVGALTGPIGLAIGLMVNDFDGFVAFVKGIPGRIVDAIKGAPELLLEVGGWVVGQILSGAESVGVRVADAAKWLLDTVVAGIQGFLAPWRAAGTWILDKIVDGFETVTGPLSGAGGWLKEKVRTYVEDQLDAFRTIGRWVLNKIADGFTTVTDALRGVGRWLKEKIDGLLGDIKDDFIGLGRKVIGWIVDGVTFVSDRGASAASGVGRWLYRQLTSVVSDVKDGVIGIGRNVIGWLVDGVTFVSDRGISGVSDVGRWLLRQLRNLLGDLKGSFSGLGKSIIGWIVDGLKNGAFALQEFLNEIIDVINILPGVDIEHITKLKKDSKGNVTGFAEGGSFSKSGVQQFATGGEVRRGTVVNKPMIMMGEEAPRHPEFVIPTNPAYRERAHMLLSQAAKATQFAAGGVMGFAQGGWIRTGATIDPTRGQWPTYDDHVGMSFAELLVAGANAGMRPDMTELLGYPRGDYGMAMGSTVFIRALGGGPAYRIWKNDNGSGQLGDPHYTIDLHEAAARAVNLPGKGDIWIASGNDSDSDGDGILDKIGGAISDVTGAVSGAAGAVAGLPAGLVSQGAGWILDKLPNPVDMLPPWLHGLGKHIIGGVADWVKDKVAGLLPGGAGGGGGGGGVLNGRTLQLPTTFASTHPTGGLAGYPAIDVFAPPGTTVLSPSDGTVSRLSGGLDTYTGPGGPYGYSIYLASKLGEYYMTHFGSVGVAAGQRVRYGQPIGTVGDYPNADSDHIHEGLRRFAEGGVFGGLPFGGSFGDGGVVPGPLGAPVGIIAHGGERVVPVGGDGGSSEDAVRLVADALREIDMRIYLGDREVTDIVRVEIDRRENNSLGVLRGGVLR